MIKLKKIMSVASLLALCGMALCACGQKFPNIGIVFSSGTTTMIESDVFTAVEEGSKMCRATAYSSCMAEKTEAEFLKGVDALFKERCGLIAVADPECGVYLQQAAADYPEITFVTIGFKVEGDNIKSLVYNNKELAFLAGVCSALNGKEGKAGGIYENTPQGQDYNSGFWQGIRYANENHSAWVEIDPDNFLMTNDPEVAKKAGLAMEERGVSYIFVPKSAVSGVVIDSLHSENSSCVLIKTGQMSRDTEGESLCQTFDWSYGQGVKSLLLQGRAGWQNVDAVKVLGVSSGIIQGGYGHQSEAVVKVLEEVKSLLGSGKIELR